MSYDTLRELEKFKKMVENNRVLVVQANGGEKVQVCKCINPHQLEHLSWMLDEAIYMLDVDTNVAKANRWLGYVQGVLSTTYGVSLDALKDANRIQDDMESLQGLPLDEAFERRPGMPKEMMIAMLIDQLTGLTGPLARAAHIIKQRR